MTAEQAFLELFSKLMPNAATVTVGTVESVDKDNRTCDVARDGQPALFNCRLNAVIDNLDSHVTAFPAIGSYVLCITLDEPVNCYVFAMSQVSEVQIKVGKTSAVIDGSDIIFNDGTLGGLVKINELTQKLNLFVQAFNGHTHPVTTTGTAVAQAGIAAAVTAPAQPFVKDDYENKNIRQ